jgi:mannonate dehydratase
LPRRDEEIENYIAAIEALGSVGIRIVSYDFMAGIDWYRTDVNVSKRGGCMTMSFDVQAAHQQVLTEWGRINEERMWQNIEYFQKAVIPVAEKAGVKMALHPDDPPVPMLRGIARILISAANYRRVQNIVPSAVNRVTLDQSIFYLMGEDIKALARESCRQNRIFYLHVRSVRGNREHFVETFQHDGAIDFGEMFQTYYDNGFRGPLRPDHDPGFVLAVHAPEVRVGQKMASGLQKILDYARRPRVRIRAELRSETSPWYTHLRSTFRSRPG